MKNMIKSLVVSSLLINFSAYANQVEDKKVNAQINLGGAYTNLNDFNGTGYKVSAKVNFPLESNAFDFYGKISHQVSHEEKQSKTFYFDESELILGITYVVSNEHLVFLEGGDIKQTFAQGEQGQWKDYFYVTRLGTQIQQGSYNVQVALEQRSGINSATGYSSAIGLFNNSMRISYTDVGDYQSLGLSFQSNF